MSKAFELFKEFVTAQGLKMRYCIKDSTPGYEAHGCGMEIGYLDEYDEEWMLVDKSIGEMIESQAFYKVTPGEQLGLGLILIAQQCINDYLTLLLHEDDTISDEISHYDSLIHRVRITYEKITDGRDDIQYINRDSYDGNIVAVSFEEVRPEDFSELLRCFYPALHERKTNGRKAG